MPDEDPRMSPLKIDRIAKKLRRSGGTATDNNISLAIISELPRKYEVEQHMLDKENLPSARATTAPCPSGARSCGGRGPKQELRHWW